MAVKGEAYEGKGGPWALELRKGWERKGKGHELKQQSSVRSAAKLRMTIVVIMGRVGSTSSIISWSMLPYHIPKLIYVRGTFHFILISNLIIIYIVTNPPQHHHHGSCRRLVAHEH